MPLDSILLLELLCSALVIAFLSRCALWPRCGFLISTFDFFYSVSHFVISLTSFGSADTSISDGITLLFE